MQRGRSQALSSGAQRQDKWQWVQWAQTGTQEVPSGEKKKFVEVLLEW